jgi:hypothetical protein
MVYRVMRLTKYPVKCLKKYNNNFIKIISYYIYIMSTGNIRGQRTQSSTGGFKTLASSIASGNNGGAFKRIYINAYQRYNGNSDLALISTIGIHPGDYSHTSSQALTTVKSASYPLVSNYKMKKFIISPSEPSSFSSSFTKHIIPKVKLRTNSQQMPGSTQQMPGSTQQMPGSSNPLTSDCCFYNALFGGTVCYC